MLRVYGMVVHFSGTSCYILMYYLLSLMSTVSKKSSDDTVMMCCASCGIAEVDDIKLKDCDGGCDLMKYCSDDCQNNHRDQHEEECKKSLRDNDLFAQPDGSHMGECPLCCLPLSIDIRKSYMMPCCSKRICIGCDYANKKREVAERLEQRCAFCREPVTESLEEVNKRLMESIKRNDPNAMYQMGS